MVHISCWKTNRFCPSTKAKPCQPILGTQKPNVSSNHRDHPFTSSTPSPQQYSKHQSSLVLLHPHLHCHLPGVVKMWTEIVLIGNIAQQQGKANITQQGEGRERKRKRQLQLQLQCNCPWIPANFIVCQQMCNGLPQLPLHSLLSGKFASCFSVCFHLWVWVRVFVCQCTEKTPLPV